MVASRPSWNGSPAKVRTGPRSAVAGCASRARGAFAAFGLLRLIAAKQRVVAWTSCGLVTFPPSMHPVPLLRVAQDEALERCIVSTGVASDLLAGVIAFDRGQGFFEAKHVLAIGLAPTRRLNDRGSGGKRYDGQALERPCRLAEKVDLDSVGRTGMLVEGKHDHVSRREAIEYRVERAALRQHAKAGSAKSPVDETVEPARLDRPTQEVKATAHVRELVEPSDRGDLPVAEVPGQDQRSLSPFQSPSQSRVIFDAHDLGLACPRQAAKEQEFAAELPQVCVVRPREAHDLLLRYCGAEHATQILDDD